VPGLSGGGTDDSCSISRLAAAVAAHGLGRSGVAGPARLLPAGASVSQAPDPDQAPDPVPQRWALPPHTWAALAARVRDERIEGLWAASVADGALQVTAEQLEEVRQAARGRANVDLHLERQLLETTAILETAGVPNRALKGPVWAHSAYPDPSWRGFGDVDLLIPSAQWYAAIEALEVAGARRTLPEIRADFDRRFGKEATLVASSGWELDLHRTFVIGPFGLWVNQDDLFDRPAQVTIGDGQVLVLSAEVSFLHACYNAALADDPPRLVAIRDVAQVLIGLDPDPARVLGLARRWRAEAVVTRALGLVTRVLGLSLDHPVAAELGRRRTTTPERILLASYRGPARGYTSQAAGVVALRGPRDKMAYLWALTRPHPAYLAARGLSPRQHLQRGAARLKARGKRPPGPGKRRRR
jgi:hypothetical protein